MRSTIRSLPEAVWTPLAVALIALVPGIVGLAAGRPFLFPSVGPTAVLQAHKPDDPSARPYNILVGHLAGLGTAFLMVTLLGIGQQKSVFELGHLTTERVAAAVLALALAAAVEIVLRAPHGPAAATTLLASLGAFKPTIKDAVTVIGGILLVIAVGEVLRRLRVPEPQGSRG
ncbi:MAG: HPP family protein [Gemmatimonadetes bacterium]|nr:HPP family protein [Gemmatimonadota bacterium]